MANKQNGFISAIWPVVMAGAALIVGVKYHASNAAWIVGGIVYAIGIVSLIGQYKKDEETLGPPAICTIGALIIWIWSASAA